MGLMNRLTGAKDGATVAEIEADLAKLDRDEAAARRAIVEIEIRRPALLLEGDEKRLDTDDRAKVTALRTIEQTEVIRGGLKLKLDEARARERAALIAEMKTEEAALTAELFQAMQDACTANERMQEFATRAAAMFGHEATVKFPARAFPLIQRQMLLPWMDYLSSLDGPQQRRATELPRAKKSKPIGKVIVDAIMPAPKPKRPPLSGPVGDGNMRVVLLRGGHEFEGRQLVSGQEYDLPAPLALTLLQSGAADTVAIPDATENKDS